MYDFWVVHEAFLLYNIGINKHKKQKNRISIKWIEFCMWREFMIKYDEGIEYYEKENINNILINTEDLNEETAMVIDGVMYILRRDGNDIFVEKIKNVL